MSRTEPDLPSIQTTLAHETALSEGASIEVAAASGAGTLDHEPQPGSPPERDQPR
jgi:hypothetical protein